jgi:protein-disulfide isomerase
VYRHFPLTSIHPQAQPAAEASECAAAQGKFWEYADALFANQQSLSSTYYPELAKTLKLDVDKFNLCVTSGDGKGRVTADTQDGTANGVNGTPTSFLNGRAVPGAYPYDTMKTYIDSLLAES